MKFDREWLELVKKLVVPMDQLMDRVLTHNLLGHETEEYTWEEYRRKGKGWLCVDCELLLGRECIGEWQPGRKSQKANARQEQLPTIGAQ